MYRMEDCLSSASALRGAALEVVSGKLLTNQSLTAGSTGLMMPAEIWGGELPVLILFLLKHGVAYLASHTRKHG